MDKIIEDIEVRTDLAKVTMKSVLDQPGTAARIFSNLGEAGFNVEMIAQTGTIKNRCDISFTIKAIEVDMVLQHLRNKLSEVSATGILVDKNVAMLTIYSKGFAGTPGIAGKIFSILGQNGINIDMISASLTTLSCLVPKDRANDALDAIKAEIE